MNYKIHISGLTESTDAMEISPLENPDIEFTLELQPPDWGDLKPHLDYYINSPKCDPIKIKIENKIVGIGTTVKHRNTAWLAHIIVHPDFRNKGIGKKITKALIESVDMKKYKTIYLIATELGYPVYKSVGFEIENEYVHFEKENANFDFAYSEFIMPFEDKYLECIFRMDKYVSGENREERLMEKLKSSFIFLSKGKVSGAYFPELGDGLIIAKNPSAGIELMKFRLQEKGNAILPFENKSAIEFLLDHNLKQNQKSKRMIFGKKRKWHPENLFNRVGGQIG